MPPIPESTRTSLAQRLRTHATANWPQLTTVHVRYRRQFAYVDGELTSGERLPLMRLRYGGSAHRWGTAIYVASTDSYQSQIWFSSTIEEVFDLVCDLHVTNECAQGIGKVRLLASAVADHVCPAMPG